MFVENMNNYCTEEGTQSTTMHMMSAWAHLGPETWKHYWTPNGRVASTRAWGGICDGRAMAARCQGRAQPLNWSCWHLRLYSSVTNRTSQGTPHAGAGRTAQGGIMPPERWIMPSPVLGQAGAGWWARTQVPLWKTSWWKHGRHRTWVDVHGWHSLLDLWEKEPVRQQHLVHSTYKCTAQQYVLPNQLQ